MNANYQIKLPAITLETAENAALDVLNKAKKQLGFVPNMYQNMANSPELLDIYLDGYNKFRQTSSFTSAEQEVIFLTISRENECHYCMAAHSVVADNFSKVPPEVTDAIRNGSVIPDAKLAILNNFVKVMLSSRGHPSITEVGHFLAVGYTEKNILDIILAIAIKTISNYSNHLFDTQVDVIFAHRSWGI
ncbi:MAG: carboxymuconolactone decarboxylase family protein [Burkholderiales bacterium]|nr:carboxymuconolactone decarboxylase family protein [Burkholderiales bacterium]